MVKCVCGSEKFNAVTKPGYHVTGAGETIELGAAALKLVQCSKCGVIRQQDFPFEDAAAYVEYYAKSYPPINKTYNAKDWEHDKKVAALRFKEYQLSSNSKVLDVGCGCGAFVMECREHGLEAYGCEIARYHYAKENPYIYYQRFEDINFPTEHFDAVVCHDVLEHSLAPDKLLKEMHRVCKPGGRVIIDVPRFHHVAGKHHWKDTEHLWFFDEVQLQKLLELNGFDVLNVTHPIESKSVFYCTAEWQERPSILVPPGMGDSYWSIVKMEAFLKREKLGIPDVTIVCNRDKKFGGHLRSVDFLRLFPFINCTGNAIANHPHFRELWKEAYATPGRTIFNDVLGHDYFISYNGHLRVGEELEDVDSDLACNWFPPMFTSLQQVQYTNFCKEKYGKYIVFYFPGYGTFKHWYNHFSLKELIKAIHLGCSQSGCIPVFSGAKWDAQDEALQTLVKKVPNSVDLMGKTSVEQVFGLIQGSQAVVGYPSGLPIMAAVLKTKTLIVWDTYYNSEFFWFCCPPEVRGKTYFIEHTTDLTSTVLADEITMLVKDGTVQNQHNYEKFYSQSVDERVQSEAYQVGRWGKKRTVNPKTNSTAAVHNMKGVVPRVDDVLSSSNLTIATFLWGDWDNGGAEGKYVERLFNMIQRNTTLSFNFVCFTDRKHLVGTSKEIKYVLLPQKVTDLSKNFTKIWVYSATNELHGRVVLFDLDTVITGNIDAMLSYSGPWCGIKAFKETRHHFGGGMISFQKEQYTWLWDELFTNYDKWNAEVKGQERFLYQALLPSDTDTWQDLFPNQLVSYKRQCQRRLPTAARIVAFHGKPRPHEVQDKWVKQYWK